MLQFQVKGEGPQPYIYVYPLSHRLPFRLQQNTAESPVLHSHSLLVTHVEYSSMYMAIPKSIPYSHSFPWQPKVHFLSLLEEAYEKGLHQ